MILWAKPAVGPSVSAVPVQTSPAPSCSKFPSLLQAHFPSKPAAVSLACSSCHDTVLKSGFFLASTPHTRFPACSRRCLYPPSTHSHHPASAVNIIVPGPHCQLNQRLSFFGPASSRQHPRFLLRFSSAVQQRVL